MRVLVTGASGFIGSHLVDRLLARGDAVTCLARSPSRACTLRDMGAQIVTGDVTSRDAVRAALQGVDAVVHLAGVYEFGPAHTRRMRAVNVEGTRNTLELAAELGVLRIVHTSTVAVFGNTHHRTVDESYKASEEDLASEYDRTKWEAHYEVAVRLQQQGAPVIITQPGVVTGPGDTSPHTLLMDLFLARMPVMLGAQSGVTWAHVDDIAEGHLLALDKGKPGESYILAGSALTMKQSMKMWQALTGLPAPKVWLPGWLAGMNAQLVQAVERAGIPLPLVTTESLRALDNFTYWASSAKAKRELGWQPRPVEETFRETLESRLKK